MIIAFNRLLYLYSKLKLSEVRIIRHVNIHTLAEVGFSFNPTRPRAGVREAGVLF